MRIDGPSIPFHIAQAYGVRPAAIGLPVQPVAPVSPVPPVMGSGARKLVAGVVPGKISFTDGGAMPSAGLSMYRHPADKNAAATGVGAGRLVDVTG
jgi:hypothetical protein